MRLLERKYGEVRLTKDFTDNIPPYAILSHTWGDDDEEVTFRDMTEGFARSKVGYRKIRFCEQQATKDGIQYFWIDTCCIDKTNSTELSEALNSMYRWYRDAVKCYVYLADVSIHDQGPRDRSSRPGNDAFRRSRWFTRGWTLQELVAPQLVEFFSIEGELLGNKKSLEQQIHSVTGIPASALRGTPLSEYSVKERFSWAEKRETKREEDGVYSLLGIFGVFLSPIYGEGRKHALERLKEQIDKSAGNDKSHEQSEDKGKNDDNDGDLQRSQRVVCYKCGEDGHYANEPHCYKCGGYGHYSYETHCYKCGEYGHYAHEPHCYRCDQWGHFAKACRN